MVSDGLEDGVVRGGGDWVRICVCAACFWGWYVDVMYQPHLTKS